MVLALDIALVACVLLYFVYLRRPSQLPPGPRGIPVLGNALEIPVNGLFLKLEEWRQVYGEVFSLNAAGQRILVLASAKAAADVLDKMSAQTSGRPRMIMMNEIMSESLNFSVLSADSRWKRMRRVMHAGFNLHAVQEYVPMQEEEVGLLCRYLLEHPGCDLHTALYRTACSVIFRALYDAPSSSASSTVEAKIDQLNKNMDAFLHAAMPLAYMVDTFPWLNYLPTWAAGWKRYGQAFFKSVDVFVAGLYEDGCQSKRDDGKSKGFVAHSEETREQFHVTKQEAAWTATVVFAAASETNSATIQAFCLAMLLFPDVQRKAQAEVDSVLGASPPTLADRERLPYIQAMIKETLRWRPPIANGFPHAASETFTYGEYVIPKGTIIMAPCWSINHDPAVFSNPAAYQPERFLTPDGRSLRPPLPDYHEDDIAYGHGRRLCPGKHFANDLLFIQMAYLLWAFDIVKAKDADGREITPPEKEFVDRGLTCHPGDFPCVFRPRQPNLCDILPSS